MQTRFTFELLLILLVAIVHSAQEDELCPRREALPGVLVLKLGNNVVLGCRGDVTVDGVPLVSPTSLNKKHRNRWKEYTTVNWTSQREAIYADANNTTNQTNFKEATTNEIYQKVITSDTYTKAKGDKWITVKPPTVNEEYQTTLRRVLRAVNQPAQLERAGGAGQETFGVTMGKEIYSEEGEDYEDYDYESQGSRVTRSIKNRARWTLNGRQVRVGVERGGILRLSHLRLIDAGNYSCYRGERLISSVSISVGVPPERPTVLCYRKSHTSKIRCDWTSKQSVTPPPLCYLLHKRGFWGNITRIPCSYSISRSRCWCVFPVEEGDRALHLAKLCVTNTIGNASSPKIIFKPQDIIKPDRPSKVMVKVVEGERNTLEVSWAYPVSWKLGYYFLNFQLRYRPQNAEEFQVVEIGERMEKELSWMIFDALPHTQYEVQLRAKDEFDGIWSDWTDTVYAFTWTAPETTTAFESNTLDTFWIYSEGSGGSGEDPGVVIISGLDNEYSTVWLYASGLFGMCFLVALTMVTAYILRHRLHFVSRIGKQSLPFSSLPRSSPSLPTPAVSEQLPEEGKTLIAPPRHSQHHFLPVPQEEQKGIHLHNMDYFLS